MKSFKEKIKIHFPGSINLLVNITNGEMRGTITIEFLIGKIPTQEEIIQRIQKAETDGTIPAGFRLMTKRETWDSFCMEEFGQKIAMPGGREFDQ